MQSSNEPSAQKSISAKVVLLVAILFPPVGLILLWMKRDTLNVERLINYALRLDVGAVLRRLGYLLEHYEMANETTLQPLLNKLSATYQRFDPVLPQEGTFLSRWRLRLNVSPEELDAVRLG